VEIEYLKSYTDRGYDFSGNLGIIRYQNEVDSNSVTRSSDLHSALDRALTLAYESHPEYRVLLGAPNLLFMIN
jgi:hypothetical protein